MELWLVPLSIAVFAISCVGIIVFYARMKARVQTADSLMLMQRQVDALRSQVAQDFSTLAQQVNEGLLKSYELIDRATSNINERLENASRIVGDVQHGLGELKESSQRIYEVGRDVASLQQVLRAPKFRGGFGELLLGDLLTQILPPGFFVQQYRFNSGDIVDAILKLSSGSVPVDAKFPLDNFQRLIQTVDEEEQKLLRKRFVRDVEKHIDDIATKYILPDEGTFDFALMYIPAENVYYEVIIKDQNAGEDNSILSYALKKKVIPVSPNSFYAYLQAIVLGLRGFQIEKNVRNVIDNLMRLETDFIRFKEDFMLVGQHLVHARKKYEEADRQLNRFGDKLTQVSSVESLPKH